MANIKQMLLEHNLYHIILSLVNEQIALSAAADVSYPKAMALQGFRYNFGHNKGASRRPRSVVIVTRPLVDGVRKL